MTGPERKLGSSPDGLTPEELACRAQDGSSESFTELVERFTEPLFNFLSRRTPNEADAEELVQETFLRAWHRLDRYDSAWRFSTWIFTIAKRLAASGWRRLPSKPLEAASAEEMPSSEDPERAISAREEDQNLWRVADRVLTEDQRSALWLRFAEDLSTDEVARILGKRPATVRVLVFRAREILVQHLPSIVEDGLRERRPEAPARLGLPRLAGSES